ncbi:MAG TPA: HAMP domain-containing sensor histidine kinase [Candidatus Angelobacter sp.]|nr:HAMP domain-containing sensor histidine kinase [Candidatus Angelobacter sp.]
MSLKTKLLLLVTVGITASVGAVAWLIEEQAHEAFRHVEQERTAALVGQFRREFEHEGDEITHGVDAIAGSDAMLRAVTELSNGAEYANYVSEAATDAAAQRLDFLDLIAPDGAIISSAHWPARFGYKQRWFMDLPAPLPQKAFLKHVETPQGNVLAMLCFRTVHVHGLNFYLIGGRKLDKVVQTLSTPEGLRVSIFSVPEQGQGELIGPATDSFQLARVMPLIQKVLDQRNENSATLDLEPAQGREEIVHAIPLPGYTDRFPAVLLVGNSLEQELLLEKRIRNISLVIAGVGVFIGVVVSGIMTARFSRPIKTLAQAATEIGHGNWDVRVETTGKDEIGKLAVAFNQMTEELMGQRERLVQSERVAAWRELARRLAHELKNPLFPLQITVENLLRARQNSPQQFDEVFQESTSTLLAEIANLKTIIGRFSDFSKMPAPQIQAVDLNELVRGVAQLFQGQLNRDPGRIEPKLQLGDPPQVSADPVLLRRVMENLVLNAIDAMPQGGTLTFRTTSDDRFAVFELSDTGAGLTAEECGRLFTPYYTTKQHGTGLGLAIAQSVISDHHGRISVSSKKDQGTTFHLELPLWDGAGIVESGGGGERVESN